MKPIAFLALLLLPLQLFAATTTAVSPATTSTLNTTSYASNAFTPAAGDLLVVFVAASGTNSGTVTMTDSQGLGFTSLNRLRKNTSADSVYLFVSNTTAAASSMTVTFGCALDAATGAVISIYRVSGMSRTGSAAIRQIQTQNNQAAAGTPAPAFAAAALTGNVTLGAVTNGANPAGVTEPTGWTEGIDDGYATPTNGLETVFRDSGFTGTTVTWGSASATAFGSMIVELDTSAASGLYPDAFSFASGAITTGVGQSITHVTASCSNRLMIAVVALIDNTAGRNLLTAVKYNGVSMTYLGRAWDHGGSELFNNLFYLIAPATGSHALASEFGADLSVSGSVADIAAVTFCGAHQTYPYKIPIFGEGSINATTMTISMTDASGSDGDWIVGTAFPHSPVIFPGGSQVNVTDQTAFNIAGSQGWGMSIRPAVIGNSLTWLQGTSDVWSMIGIAIRPATATPTQPMIDQLRLNYASTGSSTTTGTLTNIASSGCTNGLLMVGISYFTTTGATVSSVDWNGVSLTKLDANRSNQGGNFAVVEFWYRKLPAAASDDADIVFSSSVSSYGGGGLVWCLVDQTSTFGTVAKADDNSGGASTWSVTVTGTTGSVIQSITQMKGDPFPYQYFVNAAELWTGASGTGGSSTLTEGMAMPGAASVAIGGTIAAGGGTVSYSTMGVAINFGGGGGAGGSNLLTLGVGDD